MKFVENYHHLVEIFRDYGFYIGVHEDGLYHFAKEKRMVPMRIQSQVRFTFCLIPAATKNQIGRDEMGTVPRQFPKVSEAWNWGDKSAN